jgi:hypothetical protein
MQAVNKTGGPLGIAIIGSVLSAGYLARLDPVGLPAAAEAAARQSVFGGVAVARKLHSPVLLTSVHRAFVHGMNLALLVSAGVALAGAVLTLLFLPQRNAAKRPLTPGRDTEGQGVRNWSVTTGRVA